MKGKPAVFRCAGCRRTTLRLPRPWPAGSANRVVLTGRSKPNTSTRRGHSSNDVSLEYRCQDCGHVGWSTHRDLERKCRTS